MKTVFKILIIGLLISSCSLRNCSNKEVVAVVTKKENLDKYVGKLITIKGEISNTKTRTIQGIDVRFDGIIKDGTIAAATGVLFKTIVTDAKPYAANRGNGTFYRLQTNDKKDYDLAIAKIVKQ